METELSLHKIIFGTHVRLLTLHIRRLLLGDGSASANDKWIFTSIQAIKFLLPFDSFESEKRFVLFAREAFLVIHRNVYRHFADEMFAFFT